MSFSLNDVIMYGHFDGSHESIMKLAAAVSYVAPLTWTVKQEEDGTAKRMLFYNESKLDMIENGKKDSKKNAYAIVKRGEYWCTYFRSDDDKIQCGMAIIDEDMYKCTDEMFDIETFYLNRIKELFESILSEE